MAFEYLNVSYHLKKVLIYQILTLKADFMKYVKNSKNELVVLMIGTENKRNVLNDDVLKNSSPQGVKMNILGLLGNEK